MRAILTAGILSLGLAACGNGAKLGEKADLGEFKLGHNIVVAENATKGPFSRNATPEELQAALVSEIDRRMGRYEGTQFYHLGVSIDGYVLALPGIPVVASPKSIMIVSVRVWDDAAGVKINEEPEQITVFESFSGEAIVGSGLTRTKEEQLANLSANAALAIENFLKANAEWFAKRDETGTLDAAAIAAGTLPAANERSRLPPQPRP